MSLDARGNIAAIEIAVYAIVAVITLLLVIRHGFSRQSGWVFLLIFSIVRLVSGIILVVAELSKTKSVGVFTVAYILESIGLSPLLLATLGFIGLVGQVTRNGQEIIPSRILRVLRLLLSLALILGAVGGSKASSSDSSTMKTGISLRKVVSILFAVLYVVIALIHGLFWSRVDNIFVHRRTLLVAISSALPFLAIRVLYGILSSFSPNISSQSGNLGHSSPNSLSKFNTVTGEWQIYLVMGLIMEFVVVVIYCVAGMTLPLDPSKDQARVAHGESIPLQDSLRA